ncbi:peptide chain release factor N(5)-glutamine methyltransferase [Rubellimicrobium roseum]|uniref:Release factor glutamine methyltransferase n=1 Tax=Rubellimicrobium roseum TaxID=687525 RepID=A0A5C4NHM8_9RHOB|nr:peptide chain release factor N(5)-glutamine methyltransferase [Rubellimicrobium roseum]TNC73375.1 peptide chain release factor N(5)-glutamine methyltransferase [Rubellimicrobium roseum]
MTGAEALARGVRQLREAGVPDAAADARRLLAHAMGVAPGRLTLVLPEVISPAMAESYDSILAQRITRRPVSHLLGTRLFWGREFVVTPDVLDPRPETEILVAAALEEPFGRVLDLGTGSGCILLSLLADRPEATGVGLDLSPAALEVARTNAARLGVADRVQLRPSDWFAAAEGRFDLIVSNPPYIALNEMPDLEPEVRDWEPRLALTDEADGLDAYRAILSGVGPYLASGGRLAVEHGPTQASAIAALGTAQGLGRPEIRRDFDGRDRVCLFRVP